MTREDTMKLIKGYRNGDTDWNNPEFLADFILTHFTPRREGKEAEFAECLGFCRAALRDAIYCEDGLDGGAGETMIKWINELIGTDNDDNAILKSSAIPKRKA